MSGLRERVLVKGAGEQASATAHRLFRCGYRVAMTDLEQPTAIRRTVSFCSAIYEGEVEIEGVRGVRSTVEEIAAFPGAQWAHIPVCHGRRGHPVMMSAVLREELLALTGDVGARELIRAHPEWVGEFETEDEAVLFDVDRPADLGVGESGA